MSTVSDSLSLSFRFVLGDSFTSFYFDFHWCVKSQQSRQRPGFCHILSNQLLPYIWYAACNVGQTTQAHGMIKADPPVILLLLNLLRHDSHCVIQVFISGRGRKCWALISRGRGSELCLLPLYLISPHLLRCLRMTGAVSHRWERMMRSHVGGCAVAAISRPWQKKTAAILTAAPNPRQRSRHDEPATWRPHSHPSQRWLHSSECVLGLKLFSFDIVILMNWLIRNVRKSETKIELY